MSRRLIMVAVVLGLALGTACSKKKKGPGPQSFAAGSAEAAFVDMHQKFRAADGKGSWALFSSEMREAMATRMKSLREQPARLEKEIGRVPDDLASRSDEDMYQLLLSGSKMQEKLATGFPQVAGSDELEPGLREIRYQDPRRGACTQRFIKEDGAWKAQRGPVCAGGGRE